MVNCLSVELDFPQMDWMEYGGVFLLPCMSQMNVDLACLTDIIYKYDSRICDKNGSHRQVEPIGK